MHQDLLNDLINSLTILPGVGKKSAQRMALYLLDKNKDGAGILAKNLEKAIDEIGRCSRCRMLTSNDLCKICSDTSRDMNSICVVENPSDVLAIESTGGFKGRYFVLLGRLSPIEGISPDDLGINDFLKLIKIENIKEVILATSSTVEGDATAIYIKDHIKDIKVSRISYGIPIGGELEYVDGNTIARAIQGRTEINVDKSDKWITEMSKTQSMIEPFSENQVRLDKDGEKLISYGVSSYGYDVRCSNEFKVFTNIHSAIVDPKSFDEKSFVDIESDICVIPPNSFALARTVEYFKIPRNVLTVCLGKSTYARCGIIVNVTPLEPEWEGHVTLEFSNTTNLPAKIYAGEGVAQMLFFESDEECSVSYKDRGGKYQGQTGVTLPKT